MVEYLAFGGLSSRAFGVAVGCVSTSLLGQREGSGTVPCVAVIECVGMSPLGQDVAGRVVHWGEMLQGGLSRSGMSKGRDVAGQDVGGEMSWGDLS